MVPFAFEIRKFLLLTSRGNDGIPLFFVVTQDAKFSVDVVSDRRE